jgi:hypothetical protein
MNTQPNVPNTSQKTVRAYMKVKSFVSAEKPDEKQIAKFDKELSDFLETIDNNKRFLNGRNSYAVGNRIYALVWYLESIPDQPVTQPFGASSQKNNTDEQNNSTETTKN